MLRSKRTHIFCLKVSYRMWHCVLGRVPDASKCLHFQCQAAMLLPWSIRSVSVMTVCVADWRIQNPTIHPVRQGFRKNCDWKSPEISPVGAASKRAWHQKVEPIQIELLCPFFFFMMPCGLAATCQNACLNFETYKASIFAVRHGSSLHPPGTGQILMTFHHKLLYLRRGEIRITV